MSEDNKPGLTLGDIAAMSKEVPVGDSFVRVHGISAKVAVDIFKRFPKLIAMTQGFNVAKFLDAAPDAVAAIIAAGVRKPGDEATEEFADNLPLELQYDLLEAIGGLTFKSGFAPFVEKIMRLAGVVPPFNPSGKVPATTSPPELKTSSPTDTTPTPSGDTPPDKSPPSPS